MRPVIARDLGPRFAAVRGRPAGWTPAPVLFREQIDDHLAAIAAAVGASPAVAATLFLQQYAAILASPVVAALHEEGRVLPCGMTDVSVEVTAGRPVRMAFAGPARRAEDLARARRDGPASLVDRHLDGVVDVLHRRTRAGRRVLRGAVAHAVGTAFLHLSWRHPDHARHLGAARAFLAAAGLARLVEVDAVEVAGTSWLHTHRNTCCLAFRAERNQVGPDRYCADCPVVPLATRRAAFDEAVRSYQHRVIPSSRTSAPRRGP